MTVMIVVGLGVAGAVGALLRSWRRRDEHADLGSVSSHWVAEQRFGQTQDPQR